MYIHTFEVSSILTNKAFYNIQNILKAKDKSKWESEPEAFIYWGLSKKGILIHMFRIKKKGYHSYCISYRISARRVIDNDNFVGLFNINDYPALEEKVNKLLKDECKDLPKLKKCKLKRLDFCVNTELESQEEVLAYIKTCKRGNIPYPFKLKTYYDKISKRQKANKEDFTILAENNVEISIYNKYAQMAKERDGVYPEEEIEKSKNIVRIEIRCMKQKIKHYKNKYSIDTIEDFMRYGEKIGNELFHKYLGKIFGTGELYTLKEAKKRISFSEFKPLNQERMTEFIEKANNFNSAFKAIEDLKETYTKKELDKILHLFDIIDTSYITVTTRDIKEFQNGYIPNPLELYEDFMK